MYHYTCTVCHQENKLKDKIVGKRAKKPYICYLCAIIANNKTKIKDFDYKKKCQNCENEIMIRTSLRKRSSYSVKYNKYVYPTFTRFCSQKCANFYINKYENPAQTETGRKKISDFAKKRGTDHLNTPEAKLKQRMSISGRGHWNWQDGKTDADRKIRNSFEIKEWRKKVFERDNWTCVLCGARNGTGRSITLNADHIKQFALFPELRFELSNGRTLCTPCHIKTPTFAGRGNKRNRKVIHIDKE